MENIDNTSLEQLSLDELASRQGLKPITSLHEVAGDFWPEDESVDEFLKWLYETRRHRQGRAA